MNLMEITIGRLSAAVGVKIETIRYYEKIGLMPQPPRSRGGHRLYDSDQLRRLTFIRRARELGFALDDIRSLLGLEDDTPTCSEVNAITVNHLASVREKISSLRKLERTLSKIARECSLDDTPDCPIIEALSFEPLPLKR